MSVTAKANSTTTKKGGGKAKTEGLKQKTLPPKTGKTTSSQDGKNHWSGLGFLLQDDISNRDQVSNPAEEVVRRQKLVGLIRWQVVGILIAVVLLLIAAPFLKPVYRYYAVMPRNQLGELVPLSAPNLTDQAILSWTANSVTEVLTFGFGDIVEKLDQQNRRFTREGWVSFLEALGKAELVAKFRQQQLVLTTAPIDAPVITQRGINEEKEEFWVVQMPIIMTYVTNGNVTERKRPIIELTIVRVPTLEYPQGIAIKTWSLAKKT